jgi:prophage regulatory protein
MQPERFLTPKAVTQLTSFSRSTLDRKVASGDFPKPLKISDRRLAYRESAVVEWMQSKVEAA